MVLKRFSLNNLSSLMLSVALLMVTVGALPTVIALRSNAEGFIDEIIGALTTAHYLGLIIGTFRCGPLINRVGHIRAFAAFSAINAAAVLLLALFVNQWAWLFLRMVIGFSMAGLLMVVESWLNARVQSGSRGKVLALYMTICFLGAGSGQFILNLGDVTETTLFIVIAILLSLSLIPVAVTRAAHPDPVESAYMSFAKLYAVSPVAVIGCLVSGVMQGSLYGLGAIFAVSRSFSPDQVALFMGIVFASGLFTQVPIGYLSDRFDRRSVILGVVVVLAISAGILVGESRLSVPVIYVMAGILGGILATLYPLCVAYANDYLNPDQIIAASGGLVLYYGIGAAAGPLLVAFVNSLVGREGLFLVSTLVSMMYAVFVIHRSTVRSWVPVIEKERYVALPDAAALPVGSEIDPRAQVDSSYSRDT